MIASIRFTWQRWLIVLLAVSAVGLGILPAWAGIISVSMNPDGAATGIWWKA